MNNNRRNFIKTAALVGGSAAMMPFAATAAEKKSKIITPDYATLDKVLQLPVLKKELFPSPVIIEKIELLRDRRNFICRVTSAEALLRAEKSQFRHHSAVNLHVQNRTRR